MILRAGPTAAETAKERAATLRLQLPLSFQ